MSREVPYLDCCKKPVLEVRKCISLDDHNKKSLCLCSNCGSYWFYRFYEHIYFDADLPDSQIIWHVRLTKQETKDTLSGKTRLKLGGRDCFRETEGIITKTDYPPF